jgi:hypothetical protein
VVKGVPSEILSSVGVGGGGGEDRQSYVLSRKTEF